MVFDISLQVLRKLLMSSSLTRATPQKWGHRTTRKFTIPNVQFNLHVQTVSQKKKKKKIQEALNSNQSTQ